MSIWISQGDPRRDPRWLREKQYRPLVALKSVKMTLRSENVLSWEAIYHGIYSVLCMLTKSQENYSFSSFSLEITVFSVPFANSVNTMVLEPCSFCQGATGDPRSRHLCQMSALMQARRVFRRNV